MREVEKRIVLAGKDYKVTKVTPLEGSNLLRMVSTSGGRNPQEFLEALSTQEFSEVQNMLIPFIFKINKIDGSDGQQVETSVPIRLSSGVFDKDVQDAGILYMLTVVVLVFNIANFFEEDVLREFETILGGFSTSN